MDKRFWGVIGIIVVIFIGIFYINGRQDASAPAGAQLTNHVEGANKQGVTLVEYGDYQCPACGSYYPSLKQAVDKYKDDIQFQFRNFPLTSVHENAQAGARAAEAAAKQNKFWQMHDRLYDENVKYYAAQSQGGTYNTWINSSNPVSYFTQYAKDLGLNTTQFDQDFKSNAVNNAIRADSAEASRLKLSSTPSFFLNGRPVDTSRFTDQTTNKPSLDRISQVIDAAIKDKTAKK